MFFCSRVSLTNLEQMLKLTRQPEWDQLRDGKLRSCPKSVPEINSNQRPVALIQQEIVQVPEKECA